MRLNYLKEHKRAEYTIMLMENTLDCNKDIITNIEDALAFAKKHINLTYLINAEVMREQGNATRKEVLEIPEDVLKEAIINRYMPSPIL